MALATEQGFPIPVAVGTVVGGWALTGEEEASSVEEGIARMRRGVAAYRPQTAAPASPITRQQDCELGKRTWTRPASC